MRCTWQGSSRPFATKWNGRDSRRIPGSDRDRINPRRVAAQQLALGFEVQTFQRVGDVVQGVGVKARRMRKVGFEHYIVDTYGPDRVVQPLVFEPETGIDVALEILGGL